MQIACSMTVYKHIFISLVTDRLKVETANNSNSNNNNANFLQEIIFYMFMIFSIHHGCADSYVSCVQKRNWGEGCG